MSGDEIVRIIAVAVVATIQIYATTGQPPTIFAHFWDVVAKITGYLAWILGRISINARLNYFAAVRTYG